MTRLLIILMASCVAGALFLKSGTHLLLSLASVCFLIIAWQSGARHSTFGQLMFAGLVLCFAGDVIGPKHFVIGSVAFLIAHLLFILAFIKLGLQKESCLIASIFTLPISTLIIRWLWPNMPSEFQPLIIAYTTIITTMVIVSAGTNNWILAGAIIFFISDIFVARWKFIGGSENAYFCYPLYYTACTLFAFSIKRIQGDSHETGRPIVQTL